MEVVDLKLDRQIDSGAIARIIADGFNFPLHLPQDRSRRFGGKTRRLEVRRQGHLQHIDLLAGQ